MHILSASEVQRDTKRWLGDALINDIIGSNVTNHEQISPTMKSNWSKNLQANHAVNKFICDWQLNMFSALIYDTIYLSASNLLCTINDTFSQLMFFSNNDFHPLLWHNYCQWCWHFVVVQTYPSLLQKIDPCITMLAIRGNLRNIEYWQTALGSQTPVDAKLMLFPQRILAKTFVKHFFLGRNIVSGVDILSWWRHIHLQAMITVENGSR